MCMSPPHRLLELFIGEANVPLCHHVLTIKVTHHHTRVVGAQGEAHLVLC